jgi:hypothetical protein
MTAVAERLGSPGPGRDSYRQMNVV